MYKLNGVDLSSFICGFGTTLTTYNGLSTQSVGNGYLLNGSNIRYVPYSASYMPFNEADTIDEFMGNGSNIFTSSNYAVVNRFLGGYSLGSGTSEIRVSKLCSDYESFSVSYKGGGTPYSLGTLRVGSVDYPNCPPVIMVTGTARGGKGGNGIHTVDWLKTTRNAGGGGGGGGATTAFYLKMPHGNTSSFTGVLDISVGAGGIFFKRAGGGDSFIVVYAGSNGQSASDNETPGAGGRGGDYTSWATPSNVYFCMFVGNSRVKAIQGGAGGRGGRWWGNQLTGASEYTSRPLDGSAAQYPTFQFSANGQKLGIQVGGRGYYIGGGGGSSVLGRGATHLDFGNPGLGGGGDGAGWDSYVSSDHTSTPYYSPGSAAVQFIW